MFKRLPFLLTLLLALVLIVAGCGQKQTSTGNGSDQSKTSAKVSIGFSTGFTGDMAPWAEAMDKAAILAVEEINASGGVLGRQVEMFSEDNKSTVEGGVQAAEKLVKVNKVNCIIGPESDPMMALLNYAKENKVPIISTSAGTSSLDKAGGNGKYIYRTSASDSFIGVCETKVLRDEFKADRLVVIYENTEGSTSAADSVAKNFERFGGKVIDKVALNSGQSTYASELKKAYSSNPPYVYLSAGQACAINVLKGRYQKNYGGDIVGSTELQTPELVNGAGQSAYGLLSVRIVEKENSKGWDRFIKLYDQKYKEKPLTGYYQSNTYDAVILAALAMEAAKSDTGEGIDNYLTKVSGSPGVKVYSFAEGVAELKKGNDIDYEGASGPVDFNEYGSISAPAVAVMRVDDKGNWVFTKIIDSTTFPAS